MIFVNPVFHTLYHKLAHHRLLAGSLVAAARAIGVVTIGSLTIIVVGIGTLEVAVLYVVGMIVDDIEDNTDADFVQGLHHLFEFANARGRIVGVGGIAALRHVIVDRVIPPIVLWLVEARLIHGTVVVGRQDMDGVDT